MKSRAEIEADYERMIGFVPEKVRRRLEVSEQLDPQTMELFEAWRQRALTPAALDAKTVQLMAFAILLVQGSAAAENHARAAVRAGADAAELHAAAGIAAVFRGVAAFNQAGDILARLAERDTD